MGGNFICLEWISLWNEKVKVSVSVKVCLVGGVEKWEDRKWGGDRKVER